MEIQLVSLSPSCGWFIPLEKYSSVLPQGLQGAPSVLMGRNSLQHPLEGFLPAATACRLQNGLHALQFFSLKNKTKKPKPKGKRLFGVFLWMIRPFTQS